MAKETYQTIADYYAGQYGIPTNIFEAVIEHESSWQPFLVGTSGEVGLGQLMPGTAQQLGVNAWDPADNLKGAADYLSQQFKRFGNWHDALAAYNAGPGNIPAGFGYADTVMKMAGISNATTTAAQPSGTFIPGPTNGWGKPIAPNSTVTAIPDSALPSTGNPFTDWIRSQLQSLFPHTNVPAGTPTGTGVVGADGKPIGTVAGVNDPHVAPQSPADLVTGGLGAIKQFALDNVPLLGIIIVALLFGFVGIHSFLPSKTIAIQG